MSGIKSNNLQRAYQLMHERGGTTATIAGKVGTSRTYVSRVLSGEYRKSNTWLKRIRPLLTPAERDLLDSMPERQPQRTTFRSLTANPR